MQPESNPSPPPLNHCNILSALTALSGGDGGAAGTHIKEAETALLAWESFHPDEYSTELLSVIYSNVNGPNASSSAIPRLAAVLALKACVGRKWKDRGRGARPLPRRRNGGAGPAGTSSLTASSAAGTSTTMTSDQTKDAVRYAIVSIIVGATVSPGAEQQLSGMPQLSPDLAAVLTNDYGLQSACTSLVAKIGRLDLPMKFHDLIPTLVACATSADASVDPQRRYNALRALDAVLAELCDKRLLLDKKYVASVISNELSTLVNGGLVPAVDGIGNALSSGDQGLDSGRAKLALQYGTIMVSVLRRLLRHSLPAALNSASASTEAADKVFEVALQTIPVLLGVVCQQNGVHDGNGGVSGVLDEMCRLFVDVQKAYPIEFGRYIGPFLALFHKHFVDISGTILAIEEDSAVGRFVMASMTFLSNVLSCSKYEPDEKTNAAVDSILEGSSINLDGTKRTITSTGDKFSAPSSLGAIESVVRIVWGYFTTSRMEQLADLTIRRHMTLSQCRLDEWADDPEAYFHADASRASDDDINSCAQALYLSLVESRMGKRTVAPQIVTMLRDLDGQAAAARAEADGTASMDTVLLLDAVYTAAGLSLGVLEDGAGFAFSAFFDEYLLPCLEMLVREQKEETPNLPILRHRIVWLIASNTFSVPVASRSRLYQTILSIISDQSRQNDIVVKLTAAQVLNNSLFERDESLLIFKEHSDAIISALYRLASICEEYDSRSLVLSCVSFVLTYLMGCGTMSENTATAAVQPLGIIWEQSVDQHALLKRDVLSILSCIAQAVGPELSTHLHPIALPMLDVAVDPEQRDDNLFLVEDALGLWLSLVRLSPNYSESLGALFPRVQSLLEEDLEHVKVLMMITECYILLGGATFLNLYPTALQSVLIHTVGHVRPRGAAYAFLVLEALMRAYPVEGGQLLLRAGVLGTMLKSCTSFYNEDDHSEPDRVISLYLTTLSRALIASNGIVDSVFAASGDGAAAFGPSELIQLHLRLFGYEVSSTFDGLRRKLWALMLLSLLPPTVSLYGEAIVKHLDKLLHICAAVVGREGDNDPYDVGYDDDEEAFVAGETSYRNLVNKQHEQDIANTTNFRQAFTVRMESLLRVLGPETSEAVSVGNALVATGRASSSTHTAI